MASKSREIYPGHFANGGHSSSITELLCRLLKIWLLGVGALAEEAEVAHGLGFRVMAYMLSM